MRPSIAVVLAVFYVVPCVAGTLDNVQVVTSMIEAVNARELDALEEFFSADVVRHSAATPGVRVSNFEEFMAFLRADLAACPDAQQEVEIIFGAGDKVAVQAFYTGTQTGAMGPFPPSGKTMELPFMAILRLEERKIAEMWVEWDNMSALSQLGHFPMPGPEGGSD